MAKYNVPNNGIVGGLLYKVTGTQSVTYNGTLYATGEIFRGVYGIKSFTYSGSGTQEINEVPELRGASLVLGQTDADIAVNFFPEQSILRSLSVEFVQSSADIEVQETTLIRGFSIEYVDYPIYAFGIMTRRL